MKEYTTLIAIILIASSCHIKKNHTSQNDEATGGIYFVERAKEKSIGIYFDSSLFTNYIYPEEITKPVLWPVVSSYGHIVTRSFPLDKIEGERTDHPHHVGIWLTYGDVNGIDYWNNSYAIPEDKKNQYGRIEQQEVVSMKAEGNKAELVVKCQWIDSNGPCLDEETSFTFINRGSTRIIDRETKLTALKDVLFEDNKEGMYGMRMASELEMPSNQEITLTDAHGNPTTVKGKNSKASGNYLSSEGITGNDVWGTRADWMDLSGNFGEDKVSVVMIDHPDNPGYPTYWHARGYGLFAANPLGQEELSGGKEALHFQLREGEHTIFRYRIVVSDDPSAGISDWNNLTKEFQTILN